MSPAAFSGNRAEAFFLLLTRILLFSRLTTVYSLLIISFFVEWQERSFWERLLGNIGSRQEVFCFLFNCAL